MIYEEALVRVKLGTAETDSTTRAAHFKRAIKIFETMGTAHELREARAQADKNRS